MLEPLADAFLNCQNTRHAVPSEALLVDRAQLRTLMAAEMTVPVGGLRVLGASAGPSGDGEFTPRHGTLRNDLFVHLLDLGTGWTPTASGNSSTILWRRGPRFSRWVCAHPQRGAPKLS